MTVRIIYFAECYDPTHNGVVVSMKTFKEGLEAHGHEVYIVVPDNGHKVDDPHVIYLPSLHLHRDYPITATLITGPVLKKIAELKPDLIHCQHLFTTGTLGLKLGRRLNIPVFYTYHTLLTDYIHYFKIVPTALKRKMAISWSRKFCNKVDQVVTPSSPMKEILISWGVTKPIEVIPTGIPLEQFDNPYSRADLKRDWNVPEDVPLLLYLSRVAKEKNMIYLFEAARTLKTKGMKFHFLIVGGGPMLESYKQLVKQWELQDHFTFTGEQKKPGSARFFHAANVFVFPSFTETQGIVIAEAMTAGVPAVAIDRLGPQDIVRNDINGCLCNLNPSSFTDKIELLLNNEALRKKFGDQAREDAKKFSVETTVGKIENLYEREINNHRS